MATYSGQTGPSLIGRPLTDRTFLSTNLLTADDNTYNPSTFEIASPSSGVSLSGSTQFPIHVYDVREAPSINTPFYNYPHFVYGGVIVDGGTVALPDIADDTTVYLGVFNSFGYSRTVASIGLLDDQGVSVFNITVGTVFGPYEEITAELLVALEGPALIDTSFYISFTDDSVAYSVSVAGSRVGRFYSYDPDWAEGIIVDRQFLTSVFTSTGMSETRKSLRPLPSRVMTATIGFYTKDDAAKIWAGLRTVSKQQSIFPWYVDKSYMTASTEANRVYCDTAYRRFSDGGTAFLIQDGSFTSVTIDTVFSDGFSTVDTIETSYTAGNVVYPAFTCYAALDGQTMELETDFKGTIEMTMEEAVGSTLLPLENPDYVPTIRKDLPILPFSANYADTPSIGVFMGGGSEDSGRGRAQWFSGIPYVSQEISFLCRDKAECWDAVGFLNYVKGRGKPFWTISELDWIVVVSSTSNTSFVIEAPFDAVYAETLRYVKVTDSAGTYDILSVENLEDVSGGIQVTVEANSLADVSTVKQAHVMRLESDSVQEEYLTDGVMTATVSAIELQGI